MSDDKEKEISLPAGSELPESDEAVNQRGNDAYLRAMVDKNFLEYASYVIKDRAIPDVDDGLKPVQRRILWALKEIDDGRTHKAANVIGNVMHYHPHGDASIGDALVVLANKEYYIVKQGNYGNPITGSPAAASRYIECGLSKLGREVLFNDDLTEFVDSYDGRSKEPVVLPVKIPSLLMLGSDGIAVGMATTILPHNFCELIQAQISILKNEPFAVYPDFRLGGLMDVSEYDDGNGKIILRAKIELDEKHKKLIIREIPAVCTSESLIASIEKAADKNKIKISSVKDYSSDEAEIEIIPTRGYDLEKTRQALYMYTDCSKSVSVNLTVIREGRPCVMTVSDVLRRNTDKLLYYLKRELEIALDRQAELFHAKTLAQIFFENRIYKRIEECETHELAIAEVHTGVAPFREMLRRDVTDEDVEKLLALPVRRIARFDIEKNQRELAEILEEMKQLRKKLAHLTDYAIDYLTALLEKYGPDFPRHTEIEHLEKIDRSAAALNNIKIGWDRKNGYIGTAVKSDDTVVCNEFDRLLCTRKDGTYKVIALPGDKAFIDKLYDFRRYDAETVFGIIYREIKTGKYYGKRTSIGGYIMDKEYQLCPEGCKLELMTPRADAVYILTESTVKGKNTTREINLMEFPLRSAKARGALVGSKNFVKVTHNRYLTEEELARFNGADTAAETAEEEDNTPSPAPAAAPDPQPETAQPEAPVSQPEVPEKEAPAPVKEEAPAPQKSAAAPEKAENAEAETDTPLLGEVPVDPVNTEKNTPKSSRKNDEKSPDSDDDLGIIQPEFGF